MAENSNNQKKLNARKEFNRLPGHKENKRLPGHEPAKCLAPHTEAIPVAAKPKSAGMGLMGWAALAILALVAGAIVAMFFTDGRMLLDSKSRQARAANAIKTTAAAPASVATASKHGIASIPDVSYIDNNRYSVDVTPAQTVAAYSDGNISEAVGINHKTAIRPVKRIVVKRNIVIPANTSSDVNVNTQTDASTAAVNGNKAVYYFGFDSAEIPQSDILDNIASKAVASGRTVVIDAYCDPSGNSAYNLALSQRRADAVADYLEAHGVAPSHIKAHGIGSTDAYPTSSLDRRAEISFE